MITSTPRPTAGRSPDTGRLARPRRRSLGGFTLVEILIGSALSAWVLAGVLSAFLFIGRSGANIANYSDMESQARRSLEQFAQDTRQASAILWLSPTAARLTVDSRWVKYEYSAGKFVRSELDASGNVVKSLTLLSGITTFTFKAYSITGAVIPGIGTTTTLLEASNKTKQLQISLQASRTSKTVATATNTVLSARFILRNKVVTA